MAMMISRSKGFAEAVKDCPFCRIPAGRVIAENETAFAVFDAFPVTPGHTLIITRRHVRDYFSLTEKEVEDCDALLREMREHILKTDEGVKGFNIGANCGETAGQTVDHFHMHLIPRKDGDVDSPRGGIRNIFPGRGDY